MAEFIDLQQRAANFRFNVNLKKNVVSHPTVDLRSIFTASESICKRRQLRPDAEWKENGHEKDENSPSVTLTNIGDGVDSNTSLVRGIVQNSWERANVEAERAFINQYILDQAHFYDDSQKLLSWKCSGDSSDSKLSNKVFEKQVDLYAEKVSNFLKRDCSVSVQGAVVEAVEAMNDKEVTQLWRSVLPLLSVDPKEIDDPQAYRKSDKWISFIFSKATFFLQQMYKEFMESTIESNKELAQRGGVPGVFPLIEAYLNVALPCNFDYQDGVYIKHPIWAVIYNVIRSGEVQLATKIVKNLSNIADCAVLVSCISDFCEKGLDADKRMKLNAEWKHESAHCTDPFKRACYAIFLGIDCPEVTDTIENWLWVKLMQCKLDGPNMKTQFRKLQTTVCVDCGEDYFVKNGGSYSLFFTALWLTGQIERSIELLYRSGMMHHAVHIAILAQQANLLIVGIRISEFILTQDEKDPIFCRLNFARFLLLYVKNFELENVEYALSYCFFLKDLYFDKETAGGGNVFEGCVSRLCFITQQTDIILGSLTEGGDVKPGLIERFGNSVNTSDVINRVARDSDVSGETLTACKLFLMVKRGNDAFHLCSKRLASLISQGALDNDYNKKESDETIKLAHWLLNLFHKNLDANLDVSVKKELETLIRLHMFCVTAINEPLKALRQIQDLKLIPFSNEEMSVRASDYSIVSDQVKEVMHHVLITLFKIFVQLSRNGTGYSRSELKRISKIVLVFVAEVNSRSPGHLNAQILKLGTQI